LDTTLHYRIYQCDLTISLKFEFDQILMQSIRRDIQPSTPRHTSTLHKAADFVATNIIPPANGPSIV